jgi:aminoglycoside phosphotransferase family enzyme
MHKAQGPKERMQPVSIDFTTMLQELTRPQAFPFALPETPSISLIQTHASAVVLTPDRVYKLKKPQDFGFFDYSTPALRRHFCQQEVVLNGPLAPQVYLGVAPVLAFRDGHCRFGPILPPDNIPPPGPTFADGTVVDYAVVMVRLPDAAMLENWVQTDRADIPLLAEIARFVANFHTTTHTDEHIASFGSLDVIGENWEENFERFRYSDVAGEVAFLAMELDVAGRSDLSRGFVDAYIAETGDEALRELLPFYMCYRACVRGKVLSFQLDEPEISEVQREISRQQALALFSLAAHYASGPSRPALIMVGGLMGTGKSTLARALQQETG